MANPLIFFGGAEGDRTPDLMNAIHVIRGLKCPNLLILLYAGVSIVVNCGLLQPYVVTNVVTKISQT